jgi:hypothetical protein
MDYKTPPPEDNVPEAKEPAVAYGTAAITKPAPSRYCMLTNFKFGFGQKLYYII